LVNGMPHLDRLEMTAETLLEHVEYAYRVRTEMPYDVPDAMFEPYILTYRVEEEPVDPWRAELHGRFAPLAAAERTVEATARAINRELAAAVSEREKEFFGPRQSPLLTLRSGRGTDAEISILAAAAMKAVGIASRQAGVPALGSEEGAATWIEVFTGERWVPLYPLEPAAFGDFSFTEREHWRNVTVVVTRSAFEELLVTEAYTDTGTVELSFVADGEPAAGFEHFSISVLNRGALVPLDALDAVADEAGQFTATLGNGRYIIQAGTRDENGNPFVMLRDISLPPGSTKRLAFDVSPDGREFTFTREELARFEDALAMWVAFDLEGEPSRRMLPLIASVLDRRSEVLDVTFAYMGADPDNADDARDALGQTAVIKTVRDPDEWYYVDGLGEHHAIGEGGVELPVIRIYARRGGEVILHSEGYDLNIERRLSRVIDDHLQELLAQ
ncbi:MAG: transglutaminase-like domain-containing protein, partial [Candidatus Eisenbacteria bacterium]|nr:transglutaminase-like domain-containing protein [Candidatus Eisenbacteria bacterium]